MHASFLLPALAAAVVVSAQGEGAGNPPPAPVLLSTTKSGVLPVIPTGTAFAGVETEEGAIIDQGPANPSFTPVNGPATAAANLPAATYIATLPSTNFDNGTGSTVTGSITISSTSGGSGVTVNANFSGFPAEASYGPFLYHIHALAVPADGNCTSTMGHLDPTDRGEYYPCNVAAPETCQVGDLAGKHGMIAVSPFTASYADAYLSTDPSSPAFFGDKSIVIHSMNTTRLTCANFVLQNGGAATGNATNATGVTTAPTTPSQTVQPYTGAASKMSAGVVGALAGVFALFLL